MIKRAYEQQKSEGHLFDHGKRAPAVRLPRASRAFATTEMEQPVYNDRNCEYLTISVRRAAEKQRMAARAISLSGCVLSRLSRLSVNRSPS